MFYVGDKVRFVNDQQHHWMPEYYPPVGTVGEVLEEEAGNLLVRWPAGSTLLEGDWYADPEDLEVAT